MKKLLKCKQYAFQEGANGTSSVEDFVEHYGQSTFWPSFRPSWKAAMQRTSWYFRQDCVMLGREFFISLGKSLGYKYPQSCGLKWGRRYGATEKCPSVLCTLQCKRIESLFHAHRWAVLDNVICANILLFCGNQPAALTPLLLKLHSTFYPCYVKWNHF